MGEYNLAKESYRRVMALMDTPHYTDPLGFLAQDCEMDGDLTEAIPTRKEELRIVTEEWGDTTGESVDAIQREIARLTESIDNEQHRD